MVRLNKKNAELIHIMNMSSVFCKDRLFELNIRKIADI